MNEDGRLAAIIENVRAEAADSSITVEEILVAVGDKSILPAILLPALITATPLSGIPGLSAFCGILIALFSFELIFGFRELYLPDRLKNKSINADRLNATLSHILPVMQWLDAHSCNRLSFLFHRPLIFIPQLLCLVSGLAMPFLEFIPFSSSVAALGVCLLVMSMLTEDGVFFLLALLPYSVALYLIWFVAS